MSCCRPPRFGFFPPPFHRDASQHLLVTVPYGLTVTSHHPLGCCNCWAYSISPCTTCRKLEILVVSSSGAWIPDGRLYKGVRIRLVTRPSNRTPHGYGPVLAIRYNEQDKVYQNLRRFLSKSAMSGELSRAPRVLVFQSPAITGIQ